MSVRIRRSKRHHAEAGRHKDGGPRPFGITRDWSELVADEAALIREAADRVLGAQSLRSIAIDWQARGIATSRGGMWTGFGHPQAPPAGAPLRRAGPRRTRRRRRELAEDSRRGDLRSAAGRAHRPGPTTRSFGSLLPADRASALRSLRGPDALDQAQDREAGLPVRHKPEGCGGVSILADETEHQVVEHVLEAVASPTFLKVPTVDAQAEEAR